MVFQWLIVKSLGGKSAWRRWHAAACLTA